MDVLALIAAEPTLLPLWLVVAFAAGMYPVGMFFGCSTCCCPEQVSVTFSGLTKSSSKIDLTAVVFNSCFGSGAHAVLTSPGGLPETDSGPLDSVTLMDAGSGYAKLGRVEPTVTVSSVTGSGEGAEFSVTLAQQQDSCGLDRWVVASVSQTGGTGYANGDQLTFAVAEGDTEETAATAVFAPQYGEPTLTLTAPGGTGGVLSIDGYFLRTTGGAAGYYGISSVSVTNGGSGYTDNTQATITLGTGDEGFPNQATPDIRIRTGRQEPSDDWLLFPIGFAAGSGLIVSLTLTNTGDWWEATAASVVSGGTGYTVGESYSVEAVDGETFFPAEIEITSVGAGGVVAGIALTSAGEFDGADTGVIESVTIGSWQGAYRKLLSAGGISVTNGGSYYREDPTAPPYVADVTVAVSQNLPSNGSGAVVTATVGDDPQDQETFGKITDLVIEDGGSGYLAWIYADCPVGDFNGKTFTLRRTSAASCEYSACVGDSVVSATYANAEGNPEVTIYPRAGNGCEIYFYGGDVTSRAFTASELLGGIAEVEPATPDSVFTCETLGSASSVAVEVEAVDWVEKYTASKDGTAVRKATHCWPGSLYAGTYDLDFFGDVTELVPYGSGGILRTGRSFRYYYEPNALFCDTPYLELVVFPETVFFTAVVDAVMYVRLKRSTSFTNCRTGALPHKELADMDCVSGGPSNDRDFVGAADYSVSTVCPCDGGWFGTAFVFAGGGCSKPAEEGPVDETITVAGRRSFRMNVVAFSNE